MYDYGPTTDQVVRYPDDPFDRIWMPYPYDGTAWTELTTTTPVRHFSTDEYLAPTVVLQTAVTPVNSTVLRFLQWSPETNTASPPSYFVVFHNAEVANLTGNASRWFNVTINGMSEYQPMSPGSGLDNYYYYKEGLQADHYDYAYVTYENSTLPPLINAAQVYSVLELPIPMTADAEVKAILDIKAQYGVKRNWMGDPCSPEKYIWDGLRCSTTSASPTIVSINLSSSNLSGPISESFSAFTVIKYLDLSYNNLTGGIPSYLGELDSLLVLNLVGNHFNGPIPNTLLRKANSGFLTLSVDCLNATSCVPSPAPPNNKKHKNAPAVIGSSVAAVVALTIIVLAFLYIARKRGSHIGPHPVPLPQYRSRENDQPQPPLCAEVRTFPYAQLKNIAANFTRVIGRGGFGVVYLGHLEDGSEVAVKMCSQKTFHGARQFLTEVKSLSQVHHKNLVFLIGY
ncbi:hypothetical protein E2562_022717, partial [Oryza meyeriana var. granulata]